MASDGPNNRIQGLCWHDSVVQDQGLLWDWVLQVCGSWSELIDVHPQLVAITPIYLDKVIFPTRQ